MHRAPRISLYPYIPLALILYPSPSPSRSALILYRQILDAVEANDYDNFTMRAYVPKWRKFASLPQAFSRAVLPISKA